MIRVDWAYKTLQQYNTRDVDSFPKPNADNQDKEPNQAIQILPAEEGKKLIFSRNTRTLTSPNKQPRNQTKTTNAYY